METILLQIVIYLGAALIAVTLASRLGLGSVLGYILAGILIGPIFGLVGGETITLQHFAEFGVVMMLFVIGLELEPKHLWQIRHKLIGLGGLQIILSTAAFASLALSFGLAWQSAVAIGMILALSSTAIVLQTLTEKGLMQSNGGRSSFSVLLMQDVAVIPMLAILPLLVMPEVMSETTANLNTSDTAHASDSHGGEGLLDGQSGFVSAAVILGVIASIILGGMFLIKPLFEIVHAARVREMFTAITLLIIAGISYVMLMVGLSPALGAFLAGVVLANSEFKHQLESDIDPFKGLLLGLFFITVGAGIDFQILFEDPLFILAMTSGVVLIKGAVLYLIALIFKLKGASRWLFTLSLAQAGEFGFVLLAFSIQQQVLPADLSAQLLLVIALSMLITPLLFMLYANLAKRASGKHEEIDAEEIDEIGPVIIVGIGRFGQIVNRLVRSTGIKTVVLDNNLKIIKLMQAFGYRAYLGDPTRPDVLNAAGLKTASVLMVALDKPEDALKLVRYARKQRPDLHIVARAQDRVNVYRLYHAGANDIVREMFDSSLRAGRYVLENAGLTPFEASEASQAFKQHDRRANRELALKWDPERGVHENKAYIDHAKELEQELEASILAAIQHQNKPS